MKTRFMMLFWLLAAMSLIGGQYEDRWFYVARNLRTDQELADVEELVRTAGKVNLNGMLFACGVEGYAGWEPDRKARLAQLKKTCDANGVEIIPSSGQSDMGRCLAATRTMWRGFPARTSHTSPRAKRRF